MEKSRAIDLLDNLIGMIEDNHDNDYDTAFRMAIEALKAQHDCPLSAQPESCEGCIQYGLWENEIEYGYTSPCTRCKRRANDNYEGRFNQQTGGD